MKQGLLAALACTMLLAPVARADTPDEALLAAQMAYQQGNDQLAQSADRLKRASDAKQLADKRLADAQTAAADSANELAAAQAANARAREIMQKLGTDLDDAWKRKDGAQ
jgi:septal ring factor EnvC (AmiA/AmiB activator)